MALSPQFSNYDVVIVGGAIMGSSAAWFLSQNPDFDGRVLVVERDMTYEHCSTAHTNSCIRQQFSSSLNIRMSQYTADFIKNLRKHMGDDPLVPNLTIQNFGYLYLSDNDAFSEVLRRDQALQKDCGAGTEILDKAEIAYRFPFFQLDDILCGSLNTRDEGYWDGAVVFDWMRRKARDGGVEYVENEVIGFEKSADDKILSVRLQTGESIKCGTVVNASGPRAARTAEMAGISIPVEPRKRFTWVIKAENPLPLPLTIDPSGVHMREIGGGTYMIGGHSDYDPEVDPDDFTMDNDIWMDKIWPSIATRIPAFEAVKIQSEWAGHYAFNTFDQNAIVGAHSEVSNFIFMNGFSGHGLQQSPAMGRGISELITYGEFRTLDLSPFSFERLSSGYSLSERAVI